MIVLLKMITQEFSLFFCLLCESSQEYHFTISSEFSMGCDWEGFFLHRHPSSCEHFVWNWRDLERARGFEGWCGFKNLAFRTYKISWTNIPIFQRKNSCTYVNIFKVQSLSERVLRGFLQYVCHCFCCDKDWVQNLASSTMFGSGSRIVRFKSGVRN